MKFSQLFIPTLKETPAEAELISHKYLIRGGFIMKIAAGIYNYLPLGLKVIRNVENIVREEMNASGAIELLMPAVLPSELWKESGRWEVMGKELLKFKDRHERDFCIGPTHEEIITDIVRHHVRSFRQMPVNFYQIQTKFRDEIRPRFGIMRGREFIMKDAYSFDVDEEAAIKSYNIMRKTYSRIFERCGLEFRAVEADTGAIGGKFSAEFMVLAESGEDKIASCDKCSYASNLELAGIGDITVGARHAMPSSGASSGPKKVSTPDKKTVEQVTEFLGVKAENLVKTILFTTSSGPVAALVRGDHDVNEIKLRKALDVAEMEMADEAQVKEISRAAVGFAGPVGIKTKIIADWAVAEMADFVTGANEDDAHFTGVNHTKDFEVSEWADIRTADEGDACPQEGCEGKLRISRGIEVGHVFMLGTKYSESMGATYLDSDGKDREIIMGCYGIGIGRTAAAAIEQNYDDRGIIWPVPLAPFKVYVLPVDVKDDTIMDVANKIHRDLEAAGIETILDDRAERAGAKFADADLIGIPLRITIGKKGLKEDSVEFKPRADKDVRLVKLENVLDECKKFLNVG